MVYLQDMKTKVYNIEDGVSYVDKTMQELAGVFTTRFTSINDMLSGKIKTFGHSDAKSDMHFRLLFPPKGHPGRWNKKDLLPGTKPWFPPEGAGPVDDGAPVDNEEGSEDEVEMQPGGTDAVFEENEDIQLPAPKPSGKKRAASSDGLDLKKMCLDEGGPCSVAGGMQEEVILRLREGLEERTAENEELKTKLATANTNSVSVFFPLFALDSIDPSFDRRRTSVC